MNEIKNQAKADFARAKDRIIKDLATTPDDRINWAPGPGARTPINQVAHAALAIEFFKEVLGGKPLPFESVAQGDAMFRKAEKEFTTRAEVLDLLNKNCTEYVGSMDSLSEETLASTLDLPFGTFPMAAAITFPADHLRNHAAQMEYIQTCYGDFDWHMEG